MSRWDSVLRRLPSDRLVIVAEIGVWRGELSRRLLAARSGLTLWMIDRWIAPPPGDSYLESGSLMAQHPQWRFDEAMQTAMRAVEFCRGRARVLVMPSHLAATCFSDESFDLVFVDADHSYAGVCRDLTTWWSKVRRGGWIGGHDWTHHGRDDVERAVADTLGRERVELDAGNTWFLRKEATRAIPK